MMRRIAIFVLLLSSGLVLIAWLVAGLGSIDQVTVEQSVYLEGTLETLHSSTDIINDAHLTLEIDLEPGLIGDRWLVEVWWKGPDRFRIEVLETSFPSLRGLTLVMNGGRAWLYNPAGGEVIEGGSGKVRLPLVQDMISATIERAPVDTIEYPGRGTVRVQASEFNTGLTDRLFALDVPADVQWTFAPGIGPRALTVAEAREAVDFPILIPSYVPKGAALSGVFELGRVIALYYDGPIPFTIVQGWSEALGPIPQALRADLSVATSPRGLEGIFITDERRGGVFLTWVEDGVRISVAGHLSLEEAVAIAESLGS